MDSSLSLPPSSNLRPKWVPSSGGSFAPKTRLLGEPNVKCPTARRRTMKQTKTAKYWRAKHVLFSLFLFDCWKAEWSFLSFFNGNINLVTIVLLIFLSHRGWRFEYLSIILKWISMGKDFRRATKLKFDQPQIKICGSENTISCALPTEIWKISPPRKRIEPLFFLDFKTTRSMTNNYRAKVFFSSEKSQICAGVGLKKLSTIRPSFQQQQEQPQGKFVVGGAFCRCQTHVAIFIQTPLLFTSILTHSPLFTLLRRPKMYKPEPFSPPLWSQRWWSYW